MSKFVIILLVATFAACINADDSTDDFFNKASSGRNMWDDVMQIPQQAMDMGEDTIKHLQGIPNGISSGTFQSSEHSTVMRNGKVVSDEGSSKTVTNDNGTVHEISSN